jgi:hypothetical protein
VVIHYVDIPDSDKTNVDGIPCTTALRTVIDIASGIDTTELEPATHLAARHRAECLGLLTVTDNLLTVTSTGPMFRANWPTVPSGQTCLREVVSDGCPPNTTDVAVRICVGRRLAGRVQQQQINDCCELEQRPARRHKRARGGDFGGCSREFGGGTGEFCGCSC